MENPRARQDDVVLFCFVLFCFVFSFDSYVVMICFVGLSSSFLPYQPSVLFFFIILLFLCPNAFFYLLSNYHENLRGSFERGFSTRIRTKHLTEKMVNFDETLNGAMIGMVVLILFTIYIMYQCCQSNVTNDILKKEK